MTTPQVVTLRQVIAAAGVSSTTMDAWRAGTPTKKPLPYVKVGHHVFVERAKLVTWAQEHGVKLAQSHIKKTQPLPAAPAKKPATAIKSATKKVAKKPRTTH